MTYNYRNALLLLRKIAIVVLVAAPISAQALGLGRFVLHSGLDDPLNAQIDLISPTANEIKTLKASLATREDFAIAGVERAAHLFDIKYAVSQSPDGKYFLKLTTDQPIREPFLHFLIQVEWSGGRLIREYSALLDPPSWAAGRPAEIETPQLISETPVPGPVAAEAEAPAPQETLPPIGTEPEPAQAVVAETAPATVVSAVPPPSASEPAPVVQPTETAAAPVEHQEPAQMPVEYMPVAEPAAAPASPPAVAAVAGPSEYGPVKSGETLGLIAERVNADKTLTPQQVMIAMLRANPSAFIDNNVNHLKAGKILSVPERETIAAIPRDQAAREFRAQYDAWQEYKLKLAGSSRALAVAEAQPPAAKMEEAKPARPAKAEKAEKAEKKPVVGKAEPVDLLKIVRANLEQEVAEDTAKTPGVETQKDAAKEQSKLTERVATLEEAIESKQIQNKEMRERVGKLQDQVKNTERLIDLENKEMALAQKQAAEKQAAEAAAKAAAEKAAQEKAAAEAAAKAAAAAKPAETPKPAEAPKPAAPATAKKPATPPPPPETGFLDDLLGSVTGNPVTLALLGGVVVLVLGMGVFQAYRRRRATREFSESILSGSSLSAEASITDTSGQAAASDTSFLSDFSQGGMGNIHTDEVDPIAEAEVYLAYGRDEQAEEILKDAIVKDPVRQELKGKLLEIYFQRHDVGAFETLAEELYAQLEGKGGKVWDKVEEMGRKLSPNNPMFRGGKPAAAAAVAGAAATTMLVSEPAAAVETTAGAMETQGLEFATETAAPADAGMSLDFTPPAAPAESALDMTLDFDTGKTESAAPAGGGFDMDLDLGGAAEPAASGIDFDLPSTADSGGLDFTAAAEEPAATGLDFTPGGMAETTLDFDQAPAVATAEAEPGLPGWDETATKLDLAKAYIDMGDSEGARSILDEVMAEGNDQQKQQARDLASQIAA